MIRKIEVKQKAWRKEWGCDEKGACNYKVIDTVVLIDNVESIYEYNKNIFINFSEEQEDCIQVYDSIEALQEKLNIYFIFGEIIFFNEGSPIKRTGGCPMKSILYIEREGDGFKIWFKGMMSILIEKEKVEDVYFLKYWFDKISQKGE